MVPGGHGPVGVPGSTYMVSASEEDFGFGLFVVCDYAEEEVG